MSITKTKVDKDEVLAAAVELESEEIVINLVKDALDFFTLATPPEEVRGFNRMVKDAAFGVALLEARNAAGDKNLLPVHTPTVIVWWSHTRESFDVLLKYRATLALGLHYRGNYS